MTAPRVSPKYPIESVDNALRLLGAFTEHRSLSVSDASDLLGVAPSTAHRLLAMLVYRGFIQQQQARDDYEVGPAMVHLARTVLRSVDLRGTARMPVQDLVKEIGETAHVQILRGSDILFIDCVESAFALRAGSRVGASLPAHCTAGGKAILSTLTEEQIRDLYDPGPLPTLTSASIRDLDAVLEEVERTRERGFALNLEEAEEHLNAVAAPIRPAEAHMAWAAVTIAAPSHRLPVQRAEEIGPRLVETAALIAEGLV